MLDAVGAGVLAGLAIAIPVGPIAVLIIETGLRRGLPMAAAAGAGAATVDGLYATIAGLVGASLAALVDPLVGPARLAGAGVLGLIALRGLASGVRAARVASPAGTGPGRAGLAGTYALFVGLTAVNPMTFLYFAALMLGLPALSGAAERLAFAAAAFAASLAWQLLLAGVGAVLHGRLSPRVQAATRVVGAVVVLAFAARIALAAG